MVGAQVHKKSAGLRLLSLLRLEKMPGHANKQEATALSAVYVFKDCPIVPLLSVSQASVMRPYDLQLKSPGQNKQNSGYSPNREYSF
jgi:hypothetical protein